jgi:peptidoglycan/xylan/chitin deacetylase (PgdA/CDA1 family)
MLRPTLLSLFVLSLTACAAEPPRGHDASAGYGQAVIPAPEPAKGQSRVTFAECNVEGPFIAITFDDGPHGGQTPRLLKMLKDRGIKATFFVVGQCVAENPEIARQIVTEGHEIANHSWSHPLLTNLTESSVRDQIDRTHNVIRQTTGVTPTLLRPPYGGFTVRQRAWANSVWGYKTILWDVDSLDWKHRSPSKTESIIVSATKKGSIILCHDIHKTTVDGMPATLDALRARGFKFVTVTELLGMHREPIAAKKGEAVKTATVKEAANPATTIEDLQRQPQAAHDSPATPQGGPARK